MNLGINKSILMINMKNIKANIRLLNICILFISSQNHNLTLNHFFKKVDVVTYSLLLTTAIPPLPPALP